MCEVLGQQGLSSALKVLPVMVYIVVIFVVVNLSFLLVFFLNPQQF